MVHLGRENGKAEWKGRMRSGTKRYERKERGQEESERKAEAMVRNWAERGSRPWRGAELRSMWERDLYEPGE
jgi:hypothetical protein